MARKLPTLDPDTSPRISDIAALGKLVRNQRALHGLRIDDAAALCGVSSDVLSRLENGRPATQKTLRSGSAAPHTSARPVLDSDREQPKIDRMKIAKASTVSFISPDRLFLTLSRKDAMV